MAESLLSNYRAVLVDKDETYVGLFKAKAPQHIFVAWEYYKTKITNEDVAAHWGTPIESFISSLYGIRNPTDADVALALERYDRHNSTWPVELINGSPAALRRIKAQGLVLGVVTTARRTGLNQSMEENPEIRSLFDYTQAKEDSEFHKPDPRVFDRALGWLAAQGISAHETVYVGDALTDRLAALGAGLGFIAVCTGHVTFEQFERAGVPSENILPSIAQLT